MNRISTGLVTATIVILAVVRCTPIAPSFDKRTFIPGSSNPLSGLSGTWLYTSATAASNSPDITRVIAPSATVTLSDADHPQQLSEFRTSEKTSFVFSGKIPKLIYAFFTVDSAQVSADEISRLNSAFKTQLQQLDAKTWQINVAPGVALEDSRIVRDHLTAIYVSIDGEFTNALQNVGAVSRVQAEPSSTPTVQ